MNLLKKFILFYPVFSLFHEILHWIPAYLIGFNNLRFGISPIGLYVSFSTDNPNLAIISILCPIFVESLLMLAFKSESLSLWKCYVLSDIAGILFAGSDLRVAFGINPFLATLNIGLFLLLNVFLKSDKGDEKN